MKPRVQKAQHPLGEVVTFILSKDIVGNDEYRVTFSNGDKTTMSPQSFHKLFTVLESTK